MNDEDETVKVKWSHHADHITASYTGDRPPDSLDRGCGAHASRWNAIGARLSHRSNGTEFVLRCGKWCSHFASSLRQQLLVAKVYQQEKHLSRNDNCILCVCVCTIMARTIWSPRGLCAVPVTCGWRLITHLSSYRPTSGELIIRKRVEGARLGFRQGRTGSEDELIRYSDPIPLGAVAGAGVWRLTTSRWAYID